MKTEWNLKPLYRDINDPQIEKDIEKNKKVVSLFVTKWKNRSDYTKEPGVLEVALKEYEILLQQYGILDGPSYFIGLMRILDQENPTLKAKENNLHNQALQMANQLQFFILEIGKIPINLQPLFLDYPPLSSYKHFLEQTFKNAKYNLSENEEKALNIKAKTSHSNWVAMLEELIDKQMLEVIDMDNKKKTIPYNEVSKYINSTNKKVRDYAARQVLKIFEKYSEIAEFEINSILENKKIEDDYRNIPRPDTTRHLEDDIDTEIVDTLVEVVTENFDIPHKFYKLKAKLLNQKTLQYYERYVPVLLKEKSYSFEESLDLVEKTFNNLDSELGQHIENFTKHGQYDVYPRKGKSGGAACISMGNKKYPMYILLNHTNRLSDVLALAHESGHGIHNEYSNTQSLLNSGHSTATAEVASTFFEDIVFSELLKGADKDLRKALLYKKMDENISNIFMAIACYNFEMKLHNSYRKNNYLSVGEISTLFSEEMSKYLGNAVKKDEYMKYGWVTWSHIRMFFYVYSYASGLLISKSLQALVKENPQHIEDIKNFFKAGSSKSPKDIFLDLGIDISKKEFWQKGILEIRRQLEELEAI